MNELKGLLSPPSAEYDDVSNEIIISNVYAEDGVQVQNVEIVRRHFRRLRLRDTERDAAWQEIENATDTEVPDGLPALLSEAWESKKNSREYLNAQDPKFELDWKYYEHAYKVEKESQKE